MLNFADRTGYGAFMVLWPQMVTSVVGTVIKGRVRGGQASGRARASAGEQVHARMCEAKREGEGGG